MLGKTFLDVTKDVLCLREGYLVDQCNKSCGNCKQRRHQLICLAKPPGKSLNSHLTPPEEKSSRSKTETQVQQIIRAAVFIFQPLCIVIIHWLP